MRNAAGPNLPGERFMSKLSLGPFGVVWWLRRASHFRARSRHTYYPRFGLALRPPAGRLRAQYGLGQAGRQQPSPSVNGPAAPRPSGGLQVNPSRAVRAASGTALTVTPPRDALLKAPALSSCSPGGTTAGSAAGKRPKVTTMPTDRAGDGQDGASAGISGQTRYAESPPSLRNQTRPTNAPRTEHLPDTINDGRKV